ncbi:MAG: XRE family transcriptional regulator [Clostridia bacterium]|nr:XRE family transcriptional regulator [Clostridia bacterium]
MELSTRLKSLMVATATKQEDIAKALNISQPAVSALITKGEKLRILELIRIIETMGATMEFSILLPDGRRL